jgi:kumamolisin
MNNSHVELAGSRRAPPQNALRIRDIDPHERFEVTVTLKGPDLPSPDQMPPQALSPSDIDKKWGVPTANVQKVEQVLRSYGLHINDVKQGGRSLRVSGTAAAMIAAFQPKLGIYRIPDQGDVRGREGPLMVPSELEGLISGVDGLDQRRMAYRHARAAAKPLRAKPLRTKPLRAKVQTRKSKVSARTKARPARVQSRGPFMVDAPAIVGSGPSGRLTPADLQRRYNFPPGDGAGQTIVIAEFGTPLNNGNVLPPAYIPSDVTQFCNAHQLPVPRIQIKPIDISPLNQQQYQTTLPQLSQEMANLLFAQTAETMMDVEIIAALCPKAAITVCFASWTQKGWIDFLDEVTSGNSSTPVAISISYGLAEDGTGWTQAAMNSINHRLEIAAMQGITVCISSGDDGTGCGQSGSRCHVEFPSTSPFVLAVGGTMLTSGTGGKVDEVVWWESPGQRTNNGGGSTGGGVSVPNPRPSWQTVQIASLNPTAPDGRVFPDVSALAGPPFYDNLLDGQNFPGGGTSASTPVWASLIALMNAALPANKKQRFLPPLLYKPAVAQTGFRDVVSGQNASLPNPGKGYQAGPGFDAVSGLGVPDGVKLLGALQLV